jgi:Arabinofuranosyltransferase N terminal.
LSTDQSFRIQYLNRLTDSVVPSDMNYADIPPFYPSGWFWLGGRAAALLDLPAWTAYKPLALLTLSLVPVPCTGPGAGWPGGAWD